MSEPTRAAIIGTAESWKEAPFDDPGILICTLNDGYALPKWDEIGRSDEHYDIHPFEKMWFRPKHKRIFKPGDIPEGVYVRPEGHLEWLKQYATTRPIWLNAAPPKDFSTNARRFPWQSVLEFMKARPDQVAYSASSPAPMLAHLILREFKEVHIYGIHLATAHEYREQRPNMEWLMGKAEAMGVNIVIPPACPLLKHTHVYGLESKPQPVDSKAKKRLGLLQEQYNDLVTKAAHTPRWRSKEELFQKLVRVKAEIRDAQMEQRRALMLGKG